jgi:hypothetical protein
LAQKSGKHENRRRPQPKGRVPTMPYEERPRPPASRRLPFGSAPEIITIDEVGRATMAAIEEALRAENLQAPPSRRRQSSVPAPEAAFIFEISTFVVEGAEVFDKASEAQRREFVERRLLQRLPVLSMDDVVRIDLTPGASPNTMILRVWSRVGGPSGKAGGR